MLYVGYRRCPHCTGTQLFASSPRNVFERYLFPLFLLRPARCGECLMRHLEPFWVRLQPKQRSSAAA